MARLRACITLSLLFGKADAYNHQPQDPYEKYGLDKAELNQKALDKFKARKGAMELPGFPGAYYQVLLNGTGYYSPKDKETPCDIRRSHTTVSSQEYAQQPSKHQSLPKPPRSDATREERVEYEDLLFKRGMQQDPLSKPVGGWEFRSSRDLDKDKVSKKEWAKRDTECSFRSGLGEIPVIEQILKMMVEGDVWLIALESEVFFTERRGKNWRIKPGEVWFIHLELVEINGEKKLVRHCDFETKQYCDEHTIEVVNHWLEKSVEEIKAEIKRLKHDNKRSGMKKHEREKQEAVIKVLKKIKKHKKGGKDEKEEL